MLADFVLNDVPAQINKLLDFSKMNLDDLQYCIAHQANAGLVKSLRMVLKKDEQFLPFLAENTGNTEAASIPLGICENLDRLEKMNQDKYSLLAGFGTGLSSCLMLANFKDTHFYKSFYL